MPSRIFRQAATAYEQPYLKQKASCSLLKLQNDLKAPILIYILKYPQT